MPGWGSMASFLLISRYNQGPEKAQGMVSICPAVRCGW